MKTQQQELFGVQVNDSLKSRKDKHSQATKKIQFVALVSLFVSFAILFLKYIAYFYTGSVGMFSDALESFVNIASAALAYVIISIAKKPADKNHPYGHGKAEYFASAVEGAMILIAGATIILYSAERFYRPFELQNIAEGIIFSFIAAALNAITAVYMLAQAKKYDSIALESNAKHLLADVWTTIAVIFGLFIIYVFPEHHILDPLIAIIIALHIFWLGSGMIRRSIDGLMDTAIPDKEIFELHAIIEANLPEGCKYSELRTKQQGADRFVDFKLYVNQNMTVQESHDICDVIEDKINITHNNITVVIHVEPIQS